MTASLPVHWACCGTSSGGNSSRSTRSETMALTRYAVKRLLGILPLLFLLSLLSRVLSGDLGQSIGLKPGYPVIQLLGERVFPTLALSVSSLLLALLIAVPLGVTSALKPHSFFDRFFSFLAFAEFSLPNFWLAMMLILVFSVSLNWLPSSWMADPRLASFSWPDFFAHLLLPMVVLAPGGAAALTRYVRGSMLEVLQQEFIRTAKAKGLPSHVVFYKHALRNALLPLLTLLGYSIPGLLSGAVLTETVFGWPGMGRLAVNAVFSRDYPVLMAEVLLFGFLTLIGNLVADILYACADPRIRYEQP